MIQRINADLEGRAMKRVIAASIAAFAASQPAMAGGSADPRCAHYGPGFVYAESTGFCIKVSGSIESSMRFGRTTNPFAVERSGSGPGNGFETEVKGSIDARKDTEIGPLRLFVAPKSRVGELNP
jgi:hypothetical protein